jgi:hypothetical protein
MTATFKAMRLAWAVVESCSVGRPSAVGISVEAGGGQPERGLERDPPVSHAAIRLGTFLDRMFSAAFISHSLNINAASRMFHRTNPITPRDL